MMDRVNAGNSRRQEPPIIESHVAYFVIPLPHPLGLPDKYRVICTGQTPGSILRWEDRPNVPFVPPVCLKASLRFHHADSPSRAMDVTNALFALAENMFPGDRTSARTADDDSGVPVPYTFVEMAVPFSPDDSEDGGTSDAFDIGLSYVREVQRAYYMVRRRPIRLASREAMPMLIPHGVRQLLLEDGSPAPFEVPLSMFLLHENLTLRVRDEAMDENEIQHLEHAFDQQANRGLVSDYLEFVRESDLALTEDGSYRPAVLFAATSCEVLLDNLLAHLLWEDAWTPEVAAALFDRAPDGITARVKRYYHGRLGGQWSVDKPGPLHDWFVHVASMRNRVVHGGYEPSLHEARACAAASAALANHLGTVLARRTALYPRTALALPGEVGIRRRGLWSDRLEAIRSDPEEVNWIATFSRWKEAMEAARQDAPAAAEASADAAWLYAVLRPDQDVQWVLHDRATAMAAVVDAAHIENLSRTQLEALERVQRRTPANGAGRSVAVTVAGATVREPVTLEWLPEYRLVPGCEVMVTAEASRWISVHPESGIR